MSSVAIDLVDQAGGSHHIIQGWHITRLATITGLPTSDTMDEGTLLSLAEEALIAVTGPRGSACPNISVPTYLEEFVPEVVSVDIVKFRVIYRGYPAGQIEFHSSLNQVETNVDANGNPIVVQYKYPSDYGYGGGLNGYLRGRTISQGKTIQRPLPEITYTVKMVVVTGLADMTLLVGYTAYTNKFAYPIGFIPGAPHTWLITGVSAVSRDGGNTYEFSMSMQYRVQTWDTPVVFIDPYTGNPPADLVAGTGYKSVPAPYEISFPTFIFPEN